MAPQGEFYPICCVFNTQEDANLANEKIGEKMGQQWSTPEVRVADGKWWFQQPDYNEEYLKTVIGEDITYTLEEFCLNWRPIETC